MGNQNINIKNSKEYLELEKLFMEEKNKNRLLNKQIKELKRNLEEANKTISDLKFQLSNKLNNIQNNKIIELERTIEMKNQEISQLYTRLNNKSNDIKYMPGDNIIGVGFMSVNQKIQNYIRVYKDTEIFSRIEEELYNEYPEFKEKDTYLMLNANKIKRFKTLKENNIKTGDIIQVHIYEDEI